MSKLYPGLYKRGRTWWVKFTDPSGEPVYRSTGKTNEREAVAEAKEIEAKTRENSKVVEGLPLAFQSILFRAAHESHAGKLTLARTEDLLRELHRLGNPDYERVSLDRHLAKWIADQVEHVSPRTIQIIGVRNSGSIIGVKGA